MKTLLFAVLLLLAVINVMRGESETSAICTELTQKLHTCLDDGTFKVILQHLL